MIRCITCHAINRPPSSACILDTATCAPWPVAHTRLPMRGSPTNPTAHILSLVQRSQCWQTEATLQEKLWGSQEQLDNNNNKKVHSILSTSIKVGGCLFGVFVVVVVVVFLIRKLMKKKKKPYDLMGDNLYFQVLNVKACLPFIVSDGVFCVGFQTI